MVQLHAPIWSCSVSAQWISEGRTVKVNGDGEQSRGFTYLDDIARGTLLGLKPLGYEIINLGGHEVIKINDLIRMLESLTGRKQKLSIFPLILQIWLLIGQTSIKLAACWIGNPSRG